MRYLFCPTASHGYVYSAIGIAYKLYQRGHEVAFATGANFAQIIRANGFTYIPPGPTPFSSFRRILWRDLGEIVRGVRHMLYACKQFQPDVLVASELATGAHIVAHCRQLPIAIIGLATYPWPIPEPYVKIHPHITLQELKKRAHYYHSSTIGRYNKVCQLFDIPPHDEEDYDASPLLGDLYLMQTIPALEGSIHYLPKQVHLVGSCQWAPTDTADREIEAWVQQAQEEGMPILYVAHAWTDHMPDYWPGLTEGLKEMPIRVAAAKMACETPPPPNFLVRKHMPYHLILPHAQGVVASGTTSIVLNAIAHSLPLLLITLGGVEHQAFAVSCVEAGMAMSCFPFSYHPKVEALPENVSAAALKTAVQELLHNKKYGQNAARLRQEFAQFDGPTLAANLLEKLGQTREPVWRA